MSDSVQNTRVVVVGGSHLGRHLSESFAALGAEVITASPRHGEHLDLSDEAGVERFAAKIGEVDHLVSTAAMPANGPLGDLGAEGIRRAFDAKVVGPLLLAKHLRVTRSMTFFSGFAAWRPQRHRTVMAATNGAVKFLVEALAVELAPVRVNAVSPGIVDSGVWPPEFLATAGDRALTGTVGRPDDIAQAVLYAVTNPFVTGAVLHVDGGARFA
ncbi:SDR family oxidoreductase [Actinosynnema sp. NPDC023658]|uniref:SDR family oxidoreductase n=1 Tax=Actinosynnema sp. NPDC023658 TaxID=3155465 RepID=UPI003402AC7C